VLLVVKLGIGDEASGVIDDRDEVRLSPTAVFGGEARSIHDIALPALAGEVKCVGSVVFTARCASLVESLGPEEPVKRRKGRERSFVRELAFELREDSRTVKARP
jgi:hypothetical protein